MSGYTDYSYRQILNKFNPDLMFCEMINVNLDINDSALIKMSDKEHTGVQLFGSDIQKLYFGFITLNDMGIKDLCLNMGCPQPKIYKRGAGANMLNRYDEINELLESLYKKNIRISLKIRLSENTLKYFELANKYSSPFFAYIQEQKNNYLKKLLIGLKSKIYQN
ncbi:tRNA-dihydrouridine synthase [Caviibacter abscessus]|uniref:tRNA-dihydrouridine synthase n=1 Tax=Caviibacter abscessus TaxID=1766719 RepID=UPI002F3F8B4C